MYFMARNKSHSCRLWQITTLAMILSILQMNIFDICHAKYEIEGKLVQQSILRSYGSTMWTKIIQNSTKQGPLSKWISVQLSSLQFRIHVGKIKYGTYMLPILSVHWKLLKVHAPLHALWTPHRKSKLVILGTNKSGCLLKHTTSLINYFLRPEKDVTDFSIYGSI